MSREPNTPPRPTGDESMQEHMDLMAQAAMEIKIWCDKYLELFVTHRGGGNVEGPGDTDDPGGSL